MINALSHMTNASPLGWAALLVIGGIIAIVLGVLGMQSAFSRVGRAQAVDLWATKSPPVADDMATRSFRVEFDPIAVPEMEPAPTVRVMPARPAAVEWGADGVPSWYSDLTRPAERHALNVAIGSTAQRARWTANTGAWAVVPTRHRELVGAGV